MLSGNSKWLNPAALGVVAIGAVGWGLFNLLRDEEDGCEEPSDTAQKPLAKPEVVKAETKGTVPEGSQTTTQEARSKPDLCNRAA